MNTLFAKDKYIVDNICFQIFIDGLFVQTNPIKVEISGQNETIQYKPVRWGSRQDNCGKCTQSEWLQHRNA